MMLLRLAASLLVVLLTGYALVSLFWPREWLRGAQFLLKSALAVGLGSGASSFVIFLLLWVLRAPGRRTVAAETVLCALLMTIAMLRNRCQTQFPARPRFRLRNPTQKLLAAAVAIAVVFAIANFVLLSLTSPHGGWDAWSIWNRHARFMFRWDGICWRQAFSAALFGFKPDYPLLTSGVVAASWYFAGQETVLAPIAVAFLFTAATVVLLFAAVATLRGLTQGLFALLLLLCSPSFLTQGASQYADVPLGFFYLATIALLALHDSSPTAGTLAFLAGAMTGMGAWTKNEGMLFALVVILVRMALIIVAGRTRDQLGGLVIYLLGLLPVLALVACFKLRLVDAPNEMLAGQHLHATLARLLTPDRYLFIAKAFVRQLFSVGDWVVALPVVLVMYLLLVGVNPSRTHRAILYSVTGVLLLTTAAFFGVYVVTPHDLAWHISTSLDRVLMQLWPSAILAFCILARTPEEAGSAPVRDLNLDRSVDPTCP
jgi:Dolichyl-phosphate-mannose-protein mannosyltransferase